MSPGREFSTRIKDVADGLDVENCVEKNLALFHPGNDSPHRPAETKVAGSTDDPADPAFEPGLTVNGVPVGSPGHVDGVLSAKVSSLVGDNEKITDLLRGRDIHALWAMLRLRRAPQLQRWPRRLSPSVVAPHLAPTQASLDDTTTATAGWKLPLTKPRTRPPIGGGGGGVRELADVAPAARLGVVCHVFAMLLDRKTPTGITTPGWANTIAAAVVGAGAFNSDTEGRGRFTGLLATVVAATGRPSSFATGIRKSHAAVRAELADDELAGTTFEDRPVQDFGHGHEAHAQRKLTKTRGRPRWRQDWFGQKLPSTFNPSALRRRRDWWTGQSQRLQPPSQPH